MSISKFTTSEMTPLGIGRGRGLHSTPVPFSLGDQLGGGDRTYFGEDSVHSPFRHRDVVAPQNKPMFELQPPQCTSTSVPNPPPDDVRLVE